MFHVNDSSPIPRPGLSALRHAQESASCPGQIRCTVILSLNKAESVKLVADWPAEVIKCIDNTDRKVMQLLVYYGHAGKTYKNVNAEPLRDDNSHLVKYGEDGRPKKGQSRILVIT